MHKESVTRTFEFVGSNGERDLIHEVTEQVESGTFGNLDATEEGLKSYRRVSDHAALNRLSDTEFQVVSTGEKLTVS